MRKTEEKTENKERWPHAKRNGVMKTGERGNLKGKEARSVAGSSLSEERREVGKIIIKKLFKLFKKKMKKNKEKGVCASS